MAFQFQSVEAVAPLLGNAFGVSIADIGVLIGLYFAPGVVLSLPGGAIGQKFGDKRTALIALVMMLVGSLAMALTELWSLQIAGRLVAGAGGVLLNVQLTEMITDWFAGKEMATAMAIFVNSWPAGVALSLLSLPLIGTAYGLAAVHLFVAALIAVGAVMAAFYRAPQSAIAGVASSARLSVQVMMAVIVAGLIWGLFNLGFAMIFSFGPTMLVERGYTIAQSGSVISIVLWLAVFSIPLGGFVADRLKRPQFVLVAGSLLFALLMLLLAHSGVVIPLVVPLVFSARHPAGPMLRVPHVFYGGVGAHAVWRGAPLS